MTVRSIALTALVLAIVGSVAHAGARVTWHVLGETAASVPVPLRQATAPEPPDISPIFDFAPFGKRVEVALTADPVPTPDKPVDLDGLRLTGIILAVPESASLAMIADRAGPVTSFAVGDMVREGAVLTAVGRDHVTFETGATTTTLRFTNSEDARLSGIAKLRAKIPAQFRGPAGAAAGSDVGAMAAPKGLAPAGSTPDAAIDHYRRRISDNPQSVLDDLGVSITGDGYRIGQGAPRAVLRSGLRAGDTVTKVNGVAVGTVEKDRRLFEQVAASGHARVEILRDGRTIVLSFPLR